MSTILVNNIKSYTGTTVTISGSNIFVTGKTTLGDGSGTDTVKIRAELGISGSAQVSGSIIPAGDDKHDLGSSTNQWKDLYVDGVARIDAFNLPQREADAASNTAIGASFTTSGLFTLSGSQIFSSSAFPGGTQPIFSSGDFSASLFVFQRP